MRVGKNFERYLIESIGDENVVRELICSFKKIMKKISPEDRKTINYFVKMIEIMLYKVTYDGDLDDVQKNVYIVSLISGVSKIIGVDFITLFNILLDIQGKSKIMSYIG